LSSIVALRLQLLSEIVNIVVQRLQLLALGIVLLLKIGEVPLPLIGLSDCNLEGDNGDLGRAGWNRDGPGGCCSCAGSGLCFGSRGQGNARGQHKK
jgi:hypothetical protein